MTKSSKEVEEEVRSWGFKHVFTWTDRPNACQTMNRADYPPHSHAGLTTHVILRGQLTIAYPEEGGGRTTHGVGDRVDVAAGQVHEVWIGEEGCTYVIGE